MGRGRCGGAALALMALTGLAGCGGSATAPTPEKNFDVYVQNYANQFGSSPGSTETDSVLFLVRPGTVPAGDLAKIQTMNMTWPNGTMSTPLDTTFRYTASNGVASRTVVAVDSGLPTGTYTFEAAFTDGEQIRKELDFDGHVIPPTTGVSVQDSRTFLQVSWDSPALPHYYHVALTADGDTVASAGPQHVDEGGVTMVIGFDYPQPADSLYDLILILRDDYNVREVHIPVHHGIG